MLIDLVSHGLWLMLALSGVPLLISSLTGLFVAVIQAATQIQEASIVYLVKVLTLFGVVYCGGCLFLEFILDFIRQCITELSHVR